LSMMAIMSSTRCRKFEFDHCLRPGHLPPVPHQPELRKAVRQRKREGTDIVVAKERKVARVASAGIIGTVDVVPRVPRKRPLAKLLSHRRRMPRQRPPRQQKAKMPLEAGDIDGAIIRIRIKIKIKIRMKRGRGAKSPKEVKKRRESAAIGVVSVVAATRRPTVPGMVPPERVLPGTTAPPSLRGTR